MPNDFYTPTGNPSNAAQIVSADMRAEFAAINAGFNKLPTLTGNANKIVTVNASGTALEATDRPIIGGAYLATHANGTMWCNTTAGTPVSGWNCTAFGYNTMGGVSGYYNTGFGNGVMASSNVTGANNTGIGAGALSSLTSGQSNVAVGYGAVDAITTSNFNTGVGYNALTAVTSGASNTALGAGAGDSITTGSNNTVIGYQSAGGFHVSGSNVTTVGYNARPSATTVSNEITLGDANVTSFRIPGLSLTATGKTGTGSFVLSTAPTLGSFTMLQSNLGSFAAGEWSRDANWGTYYKAPTTGLVADIGFSNNAGTVGWGISANGAGYTGGSGGTVTQITSRTTNVTLNKPCGAITLVSAAGTTAWQQFAVLNSMVAAADAVIVACRDAVDLYEIHVSDVSAGSFNIAYRTTGGTTVEQPLFTFAVIKAVTS